MADTVTTTPDIAICGASGRIGSAVVSQLEAEDYVVRPLSRAPEKLNHAHAMRADFDDPDSLVRALEGIRRAFLVSPDDRPELQARYEKAFCRAANAAGVEHIVKISAYLAGVEPLASFGIFQRAAEREVEDSGIPFTHLRPAFLMQALELFAPSVRSKRKILAPTKGGRIAFVDVADVAACASHILRFGGHVNQAYTLTGPDAIGFDAVAACLSETLGEEVRFVSVPRVPARFVLAFGERLGWNYAGLICQMFAAIDHGAEEQAFDSVEKISGNAPRSISAYLQANRSLFA